MIYDALMVKYAPDCRDRAALASRASRLLDLNAYRALSDAHDFIGGGTRFEGPGDVTLTPVRRAAGVAPPGRLSMLALRRRRATLRPRLFLASTAPDHARYPLARAMDLRRAGNRTGRRAGASALPTDAVDAAELHKIAGLSLRGSPTRLRDEAPVGRGADRRRGGAL